MKPRSSPVEEAAEEDTQSVCAECPMAEISVASFSCDVQSPSCSASTSIQSPNFRRSMELLCLQLNSTMAESKSCSRKRWKSTLFLRSESVRKTVQTYSTLYSLHQATPIAAVPSDSSALPFKPNHRLHPPLIQQPEQNPNPPKIPPFSIFLQLDRSKSHQIRPLFASHFPHRPNLPLETNQPPSLHRRRCLSSHLSQPSSKRRRFILPSLLFYILLLRRQIGLT